MDLVRDDDDSVFKTDFCKSQQFFFCPHSAHRIMRAAKNEKAGSAINTFLEMIYIHEIASILNLELVIDELPLVIQDGIRKREQVVG